MTHMEVSRETEFYDSDVLVLTIVHYAHVSSRGFKYKWKMFFRDGVYFIRFWGSQDLPQYFKGIYHSLEYFRRVFIDRS